MIPLFQPYPLYLSCFNSSAALCVWQNSSTLLNLHCSPSHHHHITSTSTTLAITSLLFHAIPFAVSNPFMHIPPAFSRPRHRRRFLVNLAPRGCLSLLTTPTYTLLTYRICILVVYYIGLFSSQPRSSVLTVHLSSNHYRCCIMPLCHAPLMIIIHSFPLFLSCYRLCYPLSLFQGFPLIINAFSSFFPISDTLAADKVIFARVKFDKSAS